MFSPCNLLWALATILFYYPNLSHSTSQMILQLWISYIMLPIVALSVPDLADCVLFMEIPFFFLHHICLIMFPVYYVVTGKVSVSFPEGNRGDVDKGFGLLVSAASTFLRYWILSCAYFALLYFTIVTGLSIWSGMNLNYMLSPPPNPGNIVSGMNFRLMSVVCCSSIFMLGRFLMVLLELSSIPLRRRWNKIMNKSK